MGSLSFGKMDKRYVDNPDDEIGWTQLTEEYYWTISLIDVRKEYFNGPNPSNGTKVNIVKKVDNSN
jgi:hypothetical protein